MITHGSLFSGIGGFDLAAERMGWENKFHCEFNLFGRKILNYYWPNAESYEDITQTDFKKWKGKIDILTGGFPCQPFSNAGKRGGTEDNRFLWPEMFRAIQEIQPAWVVAENVPGILTIEKGLVFERVCADLESEGYEVQPVIIPACATGAPHRRDRVWFIAYSEGDGNSEQRPAHSGKKLAIELNIANRAPADTDSNGRVHRKSGIESNETWEHAQHDPAEGAEPNDTNANHQILERGEKARGIGSSGTNRIKHAGGHNQERERWLEAATRLCVLDDGLSGRLDGIALSKWRTESLKAAGNAIVPEVAYRIFNLIPL